jgi:hypothetical protein
MRATLSLLAALAVAHQSTAQIFGGGCEDQDLTEFIGQTCGQVRGPA